MAPSAEVPSSLPEGYVVDSAIPIPEAIRRFQATVPNRPAAMTDGGPSVDELLQRYVRALGKRDTAALRRLVLTRAEFAYLFYPQSEYPNEPYQLQPDFVWRMFNTNGEAGVSKALERFGGAEWRFLGYECARAPRRREGFRLHGPCRVQLRSPEGSTVVVGLVNEIIERDGRFKMTGFANEL